MKNYLASCAILLCFTSATILGAQDKLPVVPTTDVVISAPAEAKVVLSAPSVARIGELVRLDVSGSTADSFKWLLVPGPNTDWLTYEDGAKAVFSARAAGEYQFIIACAKDGAVDVVTHTLKVLGPPSEPTSESLVEWIPFWNWTMALPRDECDKMADSFEAIAARADELAVPADWINATAAANRKVLGDRLDAWKPMLDKIGAVLLKRAEDGALSTPEDHAKMWKEIADGLRAS